VQTFRINIPEAAVREPEAVTRMQNAIQEKIAAIPGVSSVALTYAVPMDGYDWGDAIFRQDLDASENGSPPMRQFRFVSPGFFRTLGIPLVAGRDLTWADTYQKLPVALVSANLARECWGSPSNALGKHIRAGMTDDWSEIIGVVADVRDNGVNQDAPTSVYWPILMKSFQGGAPGAEVRRALAFAIRTPRAGSESLMKEISNAVWSVDAGLPLSDVYTLEHFYTQSMARTSFTLVMLGIAGTAGLLLGIIGLYSVIAYSVAQRRKEIGIRMALGAQRDALVGMFVRQGLILTGFGVICGLAAAAGLTRLMASLLFHVSTLDPLTYLGVTVILVATALLASYLPSRRAASVNPVETLRAE
jgi:predicted permease